MLTINTKQILTDFKGENIKQDGVELTIGTVLSLALANAESKVTLAWVLGKKFTNDDEVELKAEEVVFVKETLEANKVWNALVKGQVIEILDGKEQVAPIAEPAE